MTIASGTSGTCTWSISDAGALTVAPTNGSSGYLLRGFISMYGSDLPWRNYREQITSAAFSGTIRIYTKGLSSSATETGDASNLFNACSELANVSGIGSLRGLKRTYCLFNGCSKLSALDLSSLDLSAVESAEYMFSGCAALSRVTFGSNTRLPYNYDNASGSGFVSSGKSCRNTSNGFIVTTDRAFSELTAAERAGTWTRGVNASFSVTAQRTTGDTADEDGKDVTISVIWATDASTTTRTLKVYKKLASSASYPSSASKTVTLSGNSGNETVTISDIGDSAYDFKVEFYDGTNTFVAFPSVQSNIRLIAIDRSGHVEVLGEQCYPLFVWDSVNGSDTNPESYSGTYPVSPCFVYDKGTNGLYYCTDN